MRKSGQQFLVSKKLENWFPKSAIFHRCSVSSIDNRMCYSFDAIDIKGICDKTKTYNQIETSRWTFIFVNHSSNECYKKEVVDINKKIQLLVVAFLTNYIDVSDRG